jgi:pimeloyl-ACP methyl ester carboxylesterase
MMAPVEVGNLKVPGASLYYEVRGSGPVLLLVCGGVYDAEGYAALAQYLADDYTVVTYDRRGNSRSPLDGPVGEQRIEVHADDAHRLLAAVGDKNAPAYVFGNSSGAIIALALAAGHPEQVRTLVAHEPPLFTLLPDRDRWLDLTRDVRRTFQSDGAMPALGVFNAAFSSDDAAADSSAADTEERMPGGAAAPQDEPDAATLEMLARIGKNAEHFIGYEVPSFAEYILDLAALRASSVRVLAAVGEASYGEPPWVRGARAVSAQVETAVVSLPGDHGGFGGQADAFAKRLREVLSESDQSM